MVSVLERFSYHSSFSELSEVKTVLPSIYLSTYLPISTYLSIYLYTATYLPIYIYLSISTYLSIYIYTERGRERGVLRGREREV